MIDNWLEFKSMTQTMKESIQKSLQDIFWVVLVIL